MSNKSGIHINPKHAGQFHRDVGKKPGESITQADIAKGKASGDPAEEKRAVFAENAKGWNHSHGGSSHGSAVKSMIANHHKGK